LNKLLFAVTLLSFFLDSPEEKQCKCAIAQIEKAIKAQGLNIYGCDPDQSDLKVLTLASEYRTLLSIKKARKLTFSIVEKSVETLNRDERNKKLFEKFPASFDNIEFTLDTHQKEWGYISWVTSKKGRIDYYLRDPDGIIFPGFRLGYEKFEEVKRVLSENKPLVREVTHLEQSRKGFIELGGRWGMFIDREVIRQIKSGEFTYYFVQDGKKELLLVENGKLKAPNYQQSATKVIQKNSVVKKL
jgi:hypothetical protein